MLSPKAPQGDEAPNAHGSNCLDNILHWLYFLSFCLPPPPPPPCFFIAPLHPSTSIPLLPGIASELAFESFLRVCFWGIPNEDRFHSFRAI